MVVILTKKCFLSNTLIQLFFFKQNEQYKDVLIRVMVFNALFINILVAVSFIGGENRSTRRKPLTCRKSLTNFITYSCIECTTPERDLNSQR